MELLLQQCKELRCLALYCLWNGSEEDPLDVAAYIGWTLGLDHIIIALNIIIQDSTQYKRVIQDRAQTVALAAMTYHECAVDSEYEAEKIFAMYMIFNDMLAEVLVHGQPT